MEQPDGHIHAYAWKHMCARFPGRRMEICSHAYDASVPLPKQSSMRHIDTKFLVRYSVLFASILSSNLLPKRSAILTCTFSRTYHSVCGRSVSILSGQYVSRIKRYGEVIWVGYALWTLGAGLVLTFDRTTPQWQMVIILFIEGAGVGNVFQPTLVAAQAHSPKQDRAVVTSIRNFMRSFGGSVGLALSSAIFANCLEGSLDSVTLSLPDNYVSEVLASILSTPNVSGLDPAQVAEVLDAYMEASKAVFYTWVPFIAVCLIMCILIKDKGLQRKEEKNATSESSTTENTIIGESGGELTAISNIGDVEKPKVGNYQRGDS
jgi:MFS family permease